MKYHSMAAARVRVAIIGHTFIRMMHECLQKAIFPANYDLKECAVFHKGLGGFSVCANYEGLYNCTVTFKQEFDKFLKQLQPNIVILQLGENDLDSNIEPLIVASTLEEIGIVLTKNYQVGQVFICELFTRARPRTVSLDNYEYKRIQANKILETLLDLHQHVRFWRHRRIFGTKTAIFGEDGTHLSPFGQQRLYRSLRHAIMTAIKRHNH